MCIKVPNFKGIYAVLSGIWKCRKPRVIGANFWVQKLVGANFYAFCNYVSTQGKETLSLLHVCINFTNVKLHLVQ